MRPRKRDFRGDTRKGAKNYGIVSSDDSEAYRRKDPFAGRNRKRPSGRRVQLNICNLFSSICLFNILVPEKYKNLIKTILRVQTYI